MKRLLLLPLFALLAAALPAVAAPQGRFDPFAEAGIDQKPGARIPTDLTFTDSRGEPATLAALAGGKPLLLAPVQHDCPNICGVTLSGLVQAVSMQKFRPGRDFNIVAFGIDPKETPADAAADMKRLQEAAPRAANVPVRAVTGTAENVAAVTDALGYRYGWDERIGQYAHVAAVAVLTPDGRLGRWLYGINPQPTDVRLALADAGSGKIGNWSDALLLLCYHYDPATGTYNSVIWSLLRVGGGLTLALGIGGIAFALVRERRAARRGSV